MSAIPAWFVYIECFVADKPLHWIKLYYIHGITSDMRGMFQWSCVQVMLACVYFWFTSQFHIWIECNYSCFNQSTRRVYSYANRSAIPYPRNNILVVPPNYIELFMSTGVINRVSNNLNALCVCVCVCACVCVRTFVLCDSSFDHFTASFYANLCIGWIGSGVRVWYQ
jgi:hypothetical protein